MIQNRCSLGTPGVCPSSNALNSKSRFSISYRGIPPLPCVSYSGIRSSWRRCQDLKLQSSNVHMAGKASLLHVAAASTPRLGANEDSFSHGTIPTMFGWKHRPFLAPPRASIEMPWSVRYPASKGEKVKWWWRTLACLPYLISLRDTWKYAEALYRLYPFLERYEHLTSGFYQAFDRLPRWFVMIYFTVAYLGVVRRKEFPHFLRFNTVLSMLLENSIQITETVCSFFPVACFCGRVGYQHVWIALGVVYALMALFCMGFSLAGKYIEIPVVSEAAFIHSKM